MLWPSIDALTIGELAQGVDDDLGDERRDRELRAGRLEFGLLLFAQRADAAEIYLVDRVDVRRGVRAEHHVLGDLPRITLIGTT